MNLRPVKSSNIKAIGYDSKSKRLAVQFASGDTWHYDNVPEHEHNALLAAPSVGSHFAANIRNRYGGSRQ